MLFTFSTPELIRHLWQLKTVVFLHWCLVHAVLMGRLGANTPAYRMLCHNLSYQNGWDQLFESNGTVHIRHLCRKTAVLSCHRCLINTGVENVNYI